MSSLQVFLFPSACPFFLQGLLLTHQYRLLNSVLKYLWSVLCQARICGIRVCSGVLLSVSIGSKGDPSGTHLESFQMVSLLPDGIYWERERNHWNINNSQHQGKPHLISFRVFSGLGMILLVLNFHRNYFLCLEPQAEIRPFGEWCYW